MAIAASETRITLDYARKNLIPRNNTGFVYNFGELHGIRGLPKNRRVELLPHVLGEMDSAKFTAEPWR